MQYLLLHPSPKKWNAKVCHLRTSGDGPQRSARISAIPHGGVRLKPSFPNSSERSCPNAYGRAPVFLFFKQVADFGQEFFRLCGRRRRRGGFGGKEFLGQGVHALDQKEYAEGHDDKVNYRVDKG